MFQLPYKKALKPFKYSVVALAFATAQVAAVASPFMARTAEAASTPWSTPTAIHSPNNWDVNTVANVQSSNDTYVTDNDGDEQGYSFNLPAITAGSTIDGIEVRAEAKSTDTSGCRLGVSLSWNSGSNYTDAKYMNLTGSDSTETLGGTSNNWGRTWSASQFSTANFVLKIQDNDPGNNCDNSATTSVDQLQVRVHYTEPLTAAANPVLSSSCGLDIALVIDNSNSISSGEMTTMKNALKGFTNALDGTPTQFSVTKFGSNASVISSFTNSVADTNTAIDGVSTGGGGTNWEDGLLKAYGTFDPRADKPNLVIFASDGNPTYRIGGGNGSDVTQANIDAAMVQANVIKNAGTRMLALGIGNGLSLDNLKSISGPNANTGNVLTSDVISSDFSTLAADLAVFAAQTCGGTITTKKLIDADGNLATTNDRTPASNWSFDINGSPSNPAATTTDATGFTPAVSVQPGTYSVNESQKAGYTLLSATCTGANNNGSKQGDAVTGVQVNANNIVSCTFINTLQRGTISVTKVTNPANDPTSFSITASGSGNIAGNATRTVTTSTPVTYDVAQGTYNVTELLPAGWTQVSNTCTNVVVGPNNLHPTCTITNQKSGSLTIIKDALPNDAQEFTFGVTGLPGGTFKLVDDGNPTHSNQKVFSNLAPGQYSVTEQSTPGWSLTGLTCNGKAVQGSTATVNLTAGQNVTCTFTNTKLGSLSGTKYTANADSSLGAVLSGWTIFIDSNNNGVLDDGEQSTVTDTNGAYSFSNLLPSTYVLREVLLAGWTQIFGAGSVSLSAGQTSTGNNFGNFQNGSINGFKWNDKDGDGVVDEGENKLDGWTINLYSGQQIVSTATTANGGTYSFTNLAPGTYSVCEVQQTGWIQTYPAQNACHTIVIDQSGETNQANFGNQGRATITVNKVVSPTDDSGKFNLLINGSVYATDVGNGGTTGSVSVAAGTYSVSETAGTGTSLSDYTTTNACSWGQRGGGGEGTSVSDLTVNAGENLVCTFTNTRATGTLVLVKQVNNNHGSTLSAADFNLHVMQGDADVAGSPAAGSASGTSYTLPIGTYTVSEDMPLPSGYAQTSVICDGQSTSTVTVAAGSTKTCTITNNDIAPQLTVIKHVINDNSGTNSASDFTMNVSGTNVSSSSFPGSESGTTVTLNAGSYGVTESTAAGYDVSYSADCSGSIALGQSKTCIVTNNDKPHPCIHVDKSGPASANPGETVTYTFTVTNTGDTPLSVKSVNDSIAGQGTYVSGDTNENGKLDTTETWIYTADYTIPADQYGNVYNKVTVCAKDVNRTKVCDSDTHELVVLSKVVVTKYNDLNRNGWWDEGEPALPGWTFNLTGGWGCEDLSDFLAKAAFSQSNCYDYDRSQTTGEDGSTTFTDVMPGYTHQLTETPKEGWHLSGMDCGEVQGGLDGDTFYLSGDSIYPGGTNYCYVGNYHDASLNITKKNDTTGEVRRGTMVTYTLTVTVPEDSGMVFDAVVYDKLPAGLTYVPGSWTSTSATTTDPLFNPDGVWQLGDLYPGDSVTLTYKATVNSDAAAGTYTNVAYAEGCAVGQSRAALFFVRELGLDSETTCDEPVTTDHVTSDVTVGVPQILAASTTKTKTLVNTGSGDVLRNSLIGVLLIVTTAGAMLVSRCQTQTTK